MAVSLEKEPEKGYSVAMITDGQHFNRVLELNELSQQEANEMRTNAEGILSKVVEAYCGAEADNVLEANGPTSPVSGLVYGRIQSGKTRAMISTTAMAFDNGFRIVLVMTSNINDLVGQTHFDFSSGLRGVITFTKDDDLDQQVEHVKTQLEIGNTPLLVIGSKGPQSLRNITNFFRAIGAESYPAIIFDDEGDQASLDTSTRRRSQTPEVSLAPSPINNIIQNSLRPVLRKHVYVSVTGTPQAVLLQSLDSANRPTFVFMLPPGEPYIGGDHFFGTDEPEDNPDHLIIPVDGDEKLQLLARGSEIPAGLRRSILFFLVSGSSAIKEMGAPEKGYSYLCHPSLKVVEQEVAREKIVDFLNEVSKSLSGETVNQELLHELQEAQSELAKTLDNAPRVDELRPIILEQLATRSVLVINNNVPRQGIAYTRGLNFLIGGNTLGRGIAIRDLLTTYYLRDSKVTQIDTMHQHARMFGYREKTLSYTRLFIPKHLYYKFRDINASDSSLRGWITEHLAELPDTFPVEYTPALRPTRNSVIDINKVDTLQPGQHLFPNHIKIPQSNSSYRKVLRLLGQHFGNRTVTENELVGLVGEGVVINVDQAVEILKLIKTGSGNSWRDKTIPHILKKVSETLGDRVNLRYREARRRVAEGGFISSGTLEGQVLNQERDKEIPTLWIMAIKTVEGGGYTADLPFMYPTLVIPNRLSKLYLYSQG